MHLSQTGGIANKFWIAIPEHFKNIELDEFIIMPNHIHGIIIVNNGDAIVGNADLRSLHPDDHPIRAILVDNYDRTKMVVSKIIHGFKSSVSREIRRQLNDFNFAWQKSYYDHIIHDEDDLNRIREYIYNNPANWGTDGDKAMGELN
jgi:REP element-mobilizing transposase RayT